MADNGRNKDFSRYSRRFRDGPKPLGFGVERVMKHMDAPQTSIVEAVFSNWAHLVGDVIGAHSKPAGIADGVLTVEVENQAWASEMSWMAEELVRQIQMKLDTDEIESIKIKLAKS